MAWVVGSVVVVAGVVEAGAGVVAWSGVSSPAPAARTTSRAR